MTLRAVWLQIARWGMTLGTVPTRVLVVMGLVFLFGNSTMSGAVLVANPQVITACTPEGLGRTELSWDSEGVAPVQIRVNAVDGPPMTGWSAATGTAPTGDWVPDGMTFFLVDPGGSELAHTSVQVACQDPLTPLPGQAWESYFPLQEGNQWIYERTSRGGTANYLLWQVTGTTRVGDLTYYVVADGRPDERFGMAGTRERWFRADAEGKIYMRSPTGMEQLWLDPTGAQNEAAILKLGATDQVYTARVGVLDHVRRYSRVDSLNWEAGFIARGVGLVNRRVSMMSGSSGGFVEKLDLVYARLGGVVVLSAQELAFGVSAERSVLPVTNGDVTNCMLPCYFVACGLVPPEEDPPGTYKPCFRTRVTFRNLGSDPVELTFPSGRIFELELADANGAVVYRRSDAGVFDPAQRRVVFKPGETNYFQQVPLYAAPNQPFLSGRYRLTAKVESMDGRAFSASIDLLIE